ncbi:MAG TPA: hypothetical protein VJS17_04930, partial [Pyrinomonadaceae bacterium]|nr:hypothetical protein [Pyrinomonadaceae bacterium]
DFPLPDNFHFLLIKLLSLFSSHHGLILNLFFLLTFPLTTWTSLYVFRHFSISYLPSLLGSLLYTFIPYHFFRGEGHLFYAAYYLVPLMVLVILWTYFGTLQLIKPGTRRPSLNFRNFKAIFSLIVAVLIASSGAYYSFFGCFLLLVVGLIALIQKRDLYPLITAAILVGVISITTVVNLSPHIGYLREHGNPQSMARSAQEAERFGLKIAQMLLPISGHRVSYLAKLKHDYSHAPLTNENNNASLGFAGAIGFFLLLGALLIHRDPRDELLLALSKLNLAALLLATIGGFGSLFALLISPHIRSYNRISIYIAFFCVFAVVVMLDGIARRRVKTKQARIIFGVVVCVVLVLGILDQTSKFFVPDYRGLKAEWIDQDDFVTRAEQTVPSGSMVFQLPYVPFPEAPPVHGMLDYDHLKAYLHSKSLRWSYGAIRGREGDEWQKSVASLPVPEFLQSLAFAGFNGVYVDRHGYEDKGAAIESELATALGSTAVTSQSGRFAFFPMINFNNQLRQKFSEEEWAAKKDAVFPAVTVYWRGGFSDLEQNGDENWRWCSAQGQLDLYNRSDRERKLVLEMSFSTGYDADSDLTISGALLSDQLKINSHGRAYTMTLTVPPGHNVLEFASNAQPVKTVNDPRVLMFRVNNFRFKEIK